MMFLAEFIKFREKNTFIYNEDNKQLETADDQLYFEEISCLEESKTDDFKAYQSTEKLMEFDELMKIETDDTDPDTLFIELPESCDEEEMFSSEKSPILIHQSSQLPLKKEVKVECETFKPKIDEPSCSKSCRDEDVIFGELVTSMLSKMEDDEKRKMKKAIMNILL